MHGRNYAERVLQKSFIIYTALYTIDSRVCHSTIYVYTTFMGRIYAKVDQSI